MKKFKCFTAVLLALAMGSCIFAACGKEGEKKGEEEKPNYILINDFENFRDCFSPLIGANYFGIVDMNTDMTYVKSGSASAKIQPIGAPEEVGAAKPTLRMPLKLNRLGVDCTDFSDATMISAEIYNASDRDIEMGLYFDYGTSKTETQRYTLPHGEWYTMVYQVDRAVMDFIGAIDNMQRMNFEFPQKGEEETAPTIYMDKIGIHLTETDFVPFEMDFAENEVCDFEQAWQAVVLPGKSGTKYDPTITLNTDMKYVTSGKSSIKVDYIGNTGEITDYQYAGFILPRNLLRATGFHEKGDETKLVFDVYNANPRQQRFMIEMKNESGKVVFKNIDIYLPAGQWTTLRFTFDELNEGFTPGTPNSGGHRGMGALAAGGGTEKVEHLALHWEYGMDLSAGNYTMYFDNFRYE